MNYTSVYAFVRLSGVRIAICYNQYLKPNIGCHQYAAVDLAEWYKARVYVKPLAETTGSNQALDILVYLLCFQAWVTATGRSPFQRIPTEYGMSIYVI